MKIPFTPSIYEHAARFAGKPPYETSRDPELMFRGHRDAWLEYRHQVIVVGIDIYNLEAEAYGAPVENPGEDAIPAISRNPCHSLEDGYALKPFDPARDGRIPMVIDVARRLKDALPGTDVRVPVAGPFSVAFNLRGINGLLEDVGLNPEGVARWLMQLAKNQAAFCQAVVDAGIGVAFFESAAAPPLLSPRQFHNVELPALNWILRAASGITGSPVPCIMGGHTYPILDDMLSTGTGFLVCNVETKQREFIEKVWAEKPDVKVRVNMDAGIVACHDPEAIRREVDRIVAIARPNCLMGTGCLPLETPPSNVRMIREFLAD